MLNKRRPDVRKHVTSAGYPPAHIDRRVERTKRALGAALVQLMVERPFDDITVQDILDRAGVGRSTFYSHFRNKHDVLLTDYERMLSVMEHFLADDAGCELRVAPITEFFSHVRDASQLVDALRSSGQLEPMWEMGVAHFAQMIERRIGRHSPDANYTMPLALLSRLLAGSLIEMLKWWLDHGEAGLSPEQMDGMFHDWVRSSLRVSGGARF